MEDNSLIHPCVQIGQKILELSVNGLKKFSEGENFAGEALVFPPSEELFMSAVKSYENSISEMKQISELANAFELICNSYKFHCLGEIKYFEGRYEEARDLFLKAVSELENCISGFLSCIEYLCPLWVSPAIRAYKGFYEIEAIEAISFKAIKQEKWHEAKLLIEQDCPY
jgi:tetratricopeptide (TPR) repeat protein